MSSSPQNENNNVAAAPIIGTKPEFELNLKMEENEKVSRLEKHVLESFKGQWDLRGWVKLLDTAINLKEGAKTVAYIRNSFERALFFFPNSHGLWIKYIRWEVVQSDRSAKRLEDLFGRCLKTVLHPELFSFYLEYVKRVHGVEDRFADIPAESGNEIMKSYEFALNTVGLDMESVDLWLDCIEFLKRWNLNAVEKINLMRSIFHSAIKIPMNGIEKVWREYDIFENGFKNKIMARKLMADKSPTYMLSRTLLREVKSHVDSFRQDLQVKADGVASLGDPEICFDPSKADELEMRLQAWQRWLTWEKSNPLGFAENDLSLKNRIEYVFKQGVLYLRQSSQVWFEYMKFLSESSSPNPLISQIQQQALTALPLSASLHLAIAEYHEVAREAGTMRQVFDRVISFMESLLAAFESQEDVAKLQYDWAVCLPPWITSNDCSNIKSMLNLMYIQYIKVIRRNEGMMSARALFTRFRKSPHCSYHVYVYSAEMELHCSDDTAVAQRIFEVGAKTFSGNPDFVEQYLKFLIATNNHNNRQSVFKQAVSQLDPEKCLSLWRIVAAFENSFGDLATILDMEQQKRLKYPALEGNGSFQSFTQRNNYLDLYCEDFGGDDIVETQRTKGKERKRKDTPKTTLLPSSSLPTDDILASVPGKRLVKPNVSKLPRLDTCRQDTTSDDNLVSNVGGAAMGTQSTVQSGGNTELPSSMALSQLASKLILQLPGADRFDGPRYNVDSVIRYFRDTAQFPGSYYHRIRNGSEKKPENVRKRLKR